MDDLVLSAAVHNGHLACVELLVAHGLPSEPYLHGKHPIIGGHPQAPALIQRPLHLGPAQWRCLQHIVDAGRPVHPGTLILAASAGDETCVRYLHGNGVPLWGQAWEEADDRLLTVKQILGCGASREDFASRGVIILPRQAHMTRHLWGALRYAWTQGAPLTPAMEGVLKAKRVTTRAVLVCFHVAAALSQGSASKEGGAKVAHPREWSPGMLTGAVLGNFHAAGGASQGSRAKGGGVEVAKPRERSLGMSTGAVLGGFHVAGGASQGSGAKGGGTEGAEPRDRIPHPVISGCHVRGGVSEGSGAKVAGVEGAERRDRNPHPAFIRCHIRGRVSEGSGAEGSEAREQAVKLREVWAVMGRVPIQVVEKVIVLADLESAETLHRPLPKVVVSQSAQKAWLSQHADFVRRHAQDPLLVTNMSSMGR